MGAFDFVGDLFGPSTSTTEIPEEQKAFIRQMMAREGQLYPQIQQMLSQSGGDLDKAYQMAVGELQKYYPDVMSKMDPEALKSALTTEIQGAFPEAKAALVNKEQEQYFPEAMAGVRDFALSPAADTFLSNLRDERIKSIEGDVGNLIGSKVADLSRRGVLSSTTAEGSMAGAAKEALPYISRANEDYWNAKLALPGQTAKDVWSLASAKDVGGIDTALKKYGLASDYGGQMGNAWDAYNRALLQKLGTAQGFGDVTQNWLNTKNLSKINPYMQLYGNVSGGASQPMGQTTTTTQSPFATLAGAGGLAYGLGAFCWVAREVYGESNQKWVIFRKWLLTQAPGWFRNLYARYGERFARFIHNKPVLKAIIRRWMDRRIKGAEGMGNGGGVWLATT